VGSALFRHGIGAGNQDYRLLRPGESSDRGALALFVQVCNAVQHAHQKGIIHRDLKPSNILVTLHDGLPVPKIIDFGVAKAAQQQRLTDLTIYTQFQQMIGTPLYMSPEQAEMSGLDIDTRSDIYSLGVLLYELLTGRTPFDPEELRKAGLDEIRRTIREVEPQTPSMFLKTMADETRATIAQHRQSDPAKLRNLIRGDLEWIVMKALEKDRTRRYETANGFALELLILPAFSSDFSDEEFAAIDALHQHPALRQIDYGDDFTGYFDINATQAKEDFWKKWDSVRYERLISQALKLDDRGKLIDTAKEIRSALQLQDATTKPPLTAGGAIIRLQLCALLVYLGDHATYRSVCAELALTSKGTANYMTAERAAKAFLLLPDSGVDVAILTPLVQVTQKGAGKLDFEPWTLLVNVLANYRAGDFAAARDAGSRLAEHPKAAPQSIAAGNALLAMAAQRTGRHASATAELKAARELMVDHWQAQSYYWDWMIASMLIREAEQLVEQGSPNAK
jgi:hypothetical protein